MLIGQLVKILQDGEELKLSKRAGTLVTLEELVELIGVDALRYTLARYPSDSPLTLDVAEMTRQASDNPVFYVQYVAARTASIQRNAKDLGLTSEAFDPALLVDENEGSSAAGARRVPSGGGGGSHPARAAPRRSLSRGDGVDVPQVL